jgi:uncharacterized protein DUF4886
MKFASTTRKILTTFLLLITFSACNKAPSATKVLIIGDSLLGKFDLPKMFSDIAASRGDPVDVLGHVPGLGMSVAKRVLSLPDFMQKELPSKAWDFAVIQENSELPITSVVIPEVKSLSDAVRQNNAGTRLAFLVTWGFKDGDAANCQAAAVLCSYDSMQDADNQVYEDMARDNSGSIVPVGQAWRIVRQTHPEINLYWDDHHPSPRGTYLAACVLYDILFKKKSLGADPLKLDPAQAAILQHIADSIVFDSHTDWHRFETAK